MNSRLLHAVFGVVALSLASQSAAQSSDEQVDDENVSSVTPSTTMQEELTTSENDAMPPAFTRETWCRDKAAFDYGIVDDEFAGFQLKKGTLTGNVERFVALMYPQSNGFISKVGRHLVAADTCIVADNPNQLIQVIIEPYFVGNVPVYFASFKNDFHALFYKDDEEFIRYRLGVRK